MRILCMMSANFLTRKKKYKKKEKKKAKKDKIRSSQEKKFKFHKNKKIVLMLLNPFPSLNIRTNRKLREF